MHLLKNKHLIFVCALLLVGIGCQQAPMPAELIPETPRTVPMAEKITITTSDGVEIIGDWNPGASSRTVLLLHMMPATRISWQPFAKKLHEAGFSTLAIDFRGHGASTKTTDGRTLDYRKFTDEEQQAKIRDVEAAVSWLMREHGVGEDELAVVGASIGANLALQYAAGHHEVSAIVMLSPGLIYRGVQTEPLVEGLKENQAIFYVAAKDDVYSSLTIQKLHETTGVSQEIRNYDRGGHGTDLFESHPDLMNELVEWLEGKV